jgi:hypothetical protein
MGFGERGLRDINSLEHPLVVQKAVMLIVGINVVPNNLALRIDPFGRGERGTVHAKRLDRSVLGHKAVSVAVAIDVADDDLAKIIEAKEASSTGTRDADVE